jgi:hypothetical protein
MAKVWAAIAAIATAPDLSNRADSDTQAFKNLLRSTITTILRLGELRVVVYPNDHRPAHVHVIGNGREAVFRLNCPGGPIELRENYGFPRREIVSIVAELASRLAPLCSEWERIHGLA